MVKEKVRALLPQLTDRRSGRQQQTLGRRTRRAAMLAILATALLAPADAGAVVAHRANTCVLQNSTSSVAVTKPAGTVAGDVLVAGASSNDSGNISPPAGWTLLQSDQPDAASWYKVAGGSEPASYTFTVASASDTLVVSISAFTGGDTTTPIAGSAKSSGSSSSIPLPNTTVSRNGSMRWSSAAASPSNGAVFTFPAPMVRSCSPGSGSASEDSALGTAHEPASVATTTSRTATSTDSDPYWAYTAVVNAALPLITSISPTSGPTAGGQTVTITGDHLTGSTGVTFGGTAGTSVTVVNDNTVTVTTPAHAIGATEVRITATPGTSVDAGTADDYTYVAPPTITSISPTVGPTAGGTSVTITGTNFVGLSGAAAVRFGATNATSYTVNSATSITATAPAGTGTQNVSVTTPGGTSANSAADDYTYYAPPTVTALSPTAGPTAGGTSVTITGTNFSGLSGAAAVRFGTTNATSYTVNSPTSITATAPAGTGTQNVTVTTPGGTSANTASDDYTYYAPPTITAISPTDGPNAGGTVVTITGTNFSGLSGAAAVRFGTTNATSYTVNSATSITATAPAGTGTQNVNVTTPGGTTANTSADDYTYHGVPTITSLSPSAGPNAGGTSVTITGTNFTGLSGAAAVRFGATNATSYTVNSATSITATAPAGTGTQNVSVTNPGGTSANTVSDDYTYYAIPTITTISPVTGPATGGTVVTITGTNFAGLSGASAVRFGTTNAASYTVNSATSITATAPAGTGTENVNVTTPGGTTANTAADDFTYVPAPTVTSLSPTEGPTAGATVVTITGTNFTGASQVQFGGTNATGYTIVNATTITATAPAGTGTVDVRVTTVGGTSANTASDNYTYYAPPTVTALAPSSGPSSGGTLVTITGTNFAGLSGASAVQFGGVDATSYTVVNATTITATAPAGTGTVNVRVTTPGGTSTNVAADDFTYIPAPTITSLSPDAGPTGGANTVTITGTNFTGATQVQFGGTNASGFTIVNATTITATAPAGTGAVSVRVTTGGGTSADTAADNYTYAPAPTVTSISPMSGPAPGGTAVTITGTGFTGTTQVQFGGSNASGYTVVNATTITATAPPGTGTVDVRVTTPGGVSPNTAADDYTYVPAPTVSSIAPTSGPTTGGTLVTITGSQFTTVTQVQFGGTNATGFTVVNGNTITATAPAHAAGLADVRVTSPSGTSADTAADDFTFIGLPTVTALSPDQGTSIGGTTVTITGTEFTGATAVTFGGVNASGYTVVNATTITASAPGGAPGTVDVRVTTPSGTSANTAADNYLYVNACDGGGLAMSANNFSFTPHTLNGLNGTETSSATVQVSDMTAPGSGWKLEVGKTQFTAGAGKFLPTNAAQITNASATPAGSNCSMPTNSVTTYPIPVPISPSKVKIYNAAVGTGLGPVDVQFDVALQIPAYAQFGTYTSTWTYDLSAAP